MSNRVLSQEEIEVLLKGAQQEEQGSTTDQEDNILQEMEKDTIGEIANISMGTAATTLSQLLNKKVEITTPKVSMVKPQEIGESFPQPSVMVTVDYKEGIEGYNFFILSQRDCAVIVDLMMGGDGQVPSEELNELQISGIAEAMNQMMGSAATSMSSMFSKKVDITPPNMKITDLTTDQAVLSALQESEPLVRISFSLQVEGVIDSILAQVVPLRVVKGMVTSMMQSMQPQTASKSDAVAEAKPSESNPSREYINETEPPAPTQKTTSREQPHWQQETAVQPAFFGQLKPMNTANVPENLELIMDVPLQVSVELGKAKKTIRDIMNLGPGAVIELDRVAGEPVDMIVNGKLIAKCEVVVINETFGIRITDIITPVERLKSVN